MTSQTDFLSQTLSAATGNPFKAEALTPIPGGSKWKTLRVDNARTGTTKHVFAKWGAPEHADVFNAERDGLDRLRSAGTTLHIPRVMACHDDEDKAVLLLEWIDMAPLSASAAAALGESLVPIHRTTGERFGLARDNFIGATPQPNKQGTDWVEFWQHQRLMHQLRLAMKNRYPSKLIDRGERLAADCGAFFRDYRPVASLLHGDLWVGNAAADQEGRPVVFDPAVYYGDREADIAMTELFGGYPKDFYSAYNNAWPLDTGYAIRKNFYNLYHILNHANLFAGDYVRQSEKLVESLLAEIG
jgi:protein-ribulosamine 3-kinase